MIHFLIYSRRSVLVQRFSQQRFRGFLRNGFCFRRRRLGLIRSICFENVYVCMYMCVLYIVDALMYILYFLRRKMKDRSDEYVFILSYLYLRCFATTLLGSLYSPLLSQYIILSLSLSLPLSLSLSLYNTFNTL